MSDNKKTTLEKIKKQVAILKELIVRDSTTGLVRDSGIDDRVVQVIHEEHYLFGEGELDPNDEEVQVLQKEIEDLKGLVFKDELTKVLNRRGFYDKYKALFNDALYAKKNTGEERRSSVLSGFAVIFVDADNFKKVNDTHGHDEGDLVLKAVADTLSDQIRETDAVARFGGEEFVAVLLNADEATAVEKAEAIRKAITKKVKLSKDADWKITASLGVAALSDSDADDLDELIGYADQAMYEAKTKRGKDTVVAHSELV